jgi:phosphoribosylaminoimidazole-succinocarboxamide synthase
VELLHSGKVRDVYADGDDILLVASDRVSVYDVVPPTPIPDNGRIADAAVAVMVRSARRRRAEPRGLGYGCAGRVGGEGDPVPAARHDPGRVHRARLPRRPGPEQYRASQSISAVSLPAGLLEGSRLPTTIFTPTTKAIGAHDEFITLEHVVDRVGAETAARLRDLTIELYDRGAKIAAKNGSSSPTRSSSSAGRRTECWYWPTRR